MTRKMFAMVTTQGTAMSETALCAAHYVEPFIGFARVVGEGAEDIGSDTSFHDCTGNEELACVECGAGTDDDLHNSGDGVRVIHPGDQEWPDALTLLGDDEPTQLWVQGKGRLNELAARSVSIIGARAATSYGGHVASDFGYTLASHQITVISGGAFGIDALAHRGAIAADGLTIAVMATGLDVAYPSAHAPLFRRIAENGLLVSEYPPGTSPSRERFLARNRIVAALGLATVIVEAGLRSGSMNTAHRAHALGRPVLGVPGPITSALSAGVHSLLQDGTASLVTSAADVLKFVP